MGGMLPIPPELEAAIPGLAVDWYNEPNSARSAYVRPDQPKTMHINRSGRTGDEGTRDSMYHEGDHLMALQGRGHGLATNNEYDRLAVDVYPGMLPGRWELVERLASAEPRFAKKYGMDSAYFTPEMLKYQGAFARNLLAEQLATLSGMEQSKRVDIINDPEFRDVFKEPQLRAALSSLMGLRQTRLDAKDLQPYTPLDKQPSWHPPAAGSVEQTVNKPGMFADFKRRWDELRAGKRQHLYGDYINDQAKPMPFEKRQPPIIGVRG